MKGLERINGKPEIEIQVDEDQTMRIKGHIFRNYRSVEEDEDQPVRVFEHDETDDVWYELKYK